MVSSVIPGRASSARARNDGGEGRQKKSRRFRRLLKLITGRRQTEWTGATRCPNEDISSHIWESLIDRKRANLLRLYLPCRPLADVGVVPANAGTHSHGRQLGSKAVCPRLLRGPRRMGPGSRFRLRTNGSADLSPAKLAEQQVGSLGRDDTSLRLE